MNNQLHQFYIQEEMREAVKEFIMNHLKEITIRKAFAGESTEGICEAKNTLQNAFKQLSDTYGTTIQTTAVNVSE
jgi:hypothetical protein